MWADIVYYWTYCMYFVKQWWFVFQFNLITNPGFVFLLWQNLMLTLICAHLYRSDNRGRI